MQTLRHNLFLDICTRMYKISAFSVSFQVEVGPVKVDVADTESLQKILTCYTLRDAFSCILKH